MMFQERCRQSGLTLTFVMAAAMLSLPGCSSGTPPQPTGTVSGTVTLDGKPYSDASVVFISLQTGQAGSANINADGSYRILNPLWVGSYQVSLAPRLDEGTATEATPVYIDETVPEKYWNETTTDIVCTLNEGENTFGIELKK